MSGPRHSFSVPYITCYHIQHASLGVLAARRSAQLQSIIQQQRAWAATGPPVMAVQASNTGICTCWPVIPAILVANLTAARQPSDDWLELQCLRAHASCPRPHAYRHAKGRPGDSSDLVSWVDVDARAGSLHCARRPHGGFRPCCRCSGRTRRASSLAAGEYTRQRCRGRQRAHGLSLPICGQCNSWAWMERRGSFRLQMTAAQAPW